MKTPSKTTDRRDLTEAEMAMISGGSTTSATVQGIAIGALSAAIVGVKMVYAGQAAVGQATKPDPWN